MLARKRFYGWLPIRSTKKDIIPSKQKSLRLALAVLSAQPCVPIALSQWKGE